MRRWAGALILLTTAALCGWTWWSYEGMAGVTKHPTSSQFGIPGCFCHGFDSFNPVDSVQVWFSGPDTVIRGSSHVFRLSVVKTGNVAAGFDAAVFFGAVDTIAGQETRLHVDYPKDITHSYPKLAAGHDTIWWEFMYTAPDTFGLHDTLYANGNSVDLSGAPDSGDAWNYADHKLVWVRDEVSFIGGTNRPVAASLHQNYPNPFNPSTTISYELKRAGLVELVIFNSVGREIRTLEKGRQSPGRHFVTWDGRDDGGRHAASGVYFYRLTSGHFSAVKRMILLK